MKIFSLVSKFKSRLLLLIVLTMFGSGCSVLGINTKDKAKAMENEKADEFVWLEEIESKKSLDWVEAENQKSMAWFEKDKNFSQLKNQSKKILESEDRIVRPTVFGDYVYNFWKDAKNTRGVLRRMTKDAFVKKSKRWEIVLDIDQLAKTEKQNWVYKNFIPDSPESQRAMMMLSNGGTDASVYREFDLKNKKFVVGGFNIPEGKSYVSWQDQDHLLVATHFGDGTLTTSGYPRFVKRLKRGEKLTEAELVFEGQKKSTMIYAFSIEDDIADSTSALGQERDFGKSKYQSLSFIVEDYDFYSDGLYFVNKNKQTVKLKKPDHFKVMNYFNESFLMTPRKPDKILGKSVKPGQLLKMNYDLAKGELESFELVWDNDTKKSVQSVDVTKDYVVLNVLENVKAKVYYAPKNDLKIFKTLSAADFIGVESTVSSSIFSNQLFYTQESFLTPTSLLAQDLENQKRILVQSKKAEFKSQNLVEEQLWAKSKDGTLIPYFVIRDKNLKYNGKNKTLQYGYGGFEVSIDPSYIASAGKLWLEKGGVYVVANIRGGGEFGPDWHQAALKTNRHKAFEDFIAVAEDLIAKKITSSDHLAIQGGSNGGLLVGTVMTMRPDLFKAVVCIVPLLDMLKYSQLLAGASWMGEYGDPSVPKEREYIKTYSPYQNVKEGIKYPSLLLYTSTKDDRVHPGHARKMAALMQKHNYDVLYFENTEGGHAGSTNFEQRSKMEAMIFNFLDRTLN